jgi:hypothetical protein
MASIEAGEKFNVTIETYDIHNNPTEHAEDRFLFTFKGGQGMNVVRGVDGIAAFSKPVNVAGLHELTIVRASERARERQKGAPLRRKRVAGGSASEASANMSEAAQEEHLRQKRVAGGRAQKIDPPVAGDVAHAASPIAGLNQPQPTATAAC